MRQDFAQHFIHLRRMALTAQLFSELSLDHAERRLHVTALVVAQHESLLVELIVMEDLGVGYEHGSDQDTRGLRCRGS